jgi:hypothetical protein
MSQQLRAGPLDLGQVPLNIQSHGVHARQVTVASFAAEARIGSKSNQWLLYHGHGEKIN